MPKSAVGPINSSKNKLNSEIIFIFHFNPNAHIVSKLFSIVLGSSRLDASQF